MPVQLASADGLSETTVKASEKTMMAVAIAGH